MKPLFRDLFSSTDYHVEYCRAIQLTDSSILAAFAIQASDEDGGIRLYRSVDGGEEFVFVTEFRDPEYPWIGAPTLLELPDGAVLFSYNITTPQDQPPRGQVIKVWRTDDLGESWRYLATVEDGSNWCWEPELAFSADGNIQLYYSYAGDTMNMLEQHIVRRESVDRGATWGGREIAVGDATSHVGMARVVKMDAGYCMAVEFYESLGRVHVVHSPDGKQWSRVRNAPAMQIAGDGYMFSTPSLAYCNGMLCGMGKHYARLGLRYPPEYHPKDGKVILVSRDEGQTWEELEIPSPIQYADDSSNWSPTLLGIADDRLFLITNSDTPDEHRVVYGLIPLPGV